MYGGRDLLAEMMITEVVVCLIQPDHCPRPYAPEILERRAGSSRVERMPQLPTLSGERLYSFPAGPCFASRGTADEERYPAVAGGSLSHDVSQEIVVSTRYVAGQHSRTYLAWRRTSSVFACGVHFESMRIPVLDQSPDSAADGRILIGGGGRSPQVQKLAHRQPQ
ncbi:hypothetical protein ACFWB2_06810 [Streptomyces virginiae]|uniref:hypothetical protein n=1 Tax=Streptomyces virginiae TaxID=1961 RepID=UPI003667254D